MFDYTGDLSLYQQQLDGTPYIEQWSDRQIQVYATMVKAFGEEVEALRIRPKVPAARKPVLNQSYPGWEKALQAVQNGETSVAFLQKKYTIPPDCLALLQEAQSA